ncbi:MAG: histidinol-phosphatase HisJ family protein, partial [Bacteroidales bacterium]|nr:histidinol-phosphatase HisJ family protein [Bacteroidales bacterium]
MFFDTHNHSQFSFDGSGTTVEKSVKAAIDKGFGGICFTDHCDYFVPKMKEEYEHIVCEVFDAASQQAEIDRVTGLVADGAFGKAARKFRVLKGVEVGLYEDCRELNRNFISARQFDQVIASVHYLDDTDPYFGPYYKGKNWKEAYGHYLETLLREMRKLEDFDIMGHFDYIVRYAPYPKE